MLKPRIRCSRGQNIPAVSHIRSSSIISLARNKTRPISRASAISPTSFIAFHSQASTRYPRQNREPNYSSTDTVDLSTGNRGSDGRGDTGESLRDAAKWTLGAENAQPLTATDSASTSLIATEGDELEVSEPVLPQAEPYELPDLDLDPKFYPDTISSLESGRDADNRSISPPVFAIGREDDSSSGPWNESTTSRHLNLRPRQGYVEVLHPGQSPENPIKLSYIRLREACRCPECLDPRTLQKNITLGQVIEQVEKSGFLKAAPGNSVQVNQEYTRSAVKGAPFLSVQWGEHVSTYTTQEIYDLVDYSSSPSSQPRCSPWKDANTLVSRAKSRPGSSFGILYEELVGSSDIQRRHLLRTVLTRLVRSGFVLFKGVPTTATSNEDCALRTVANLIGPIRNTFYGETWDVVNKKEDSRNVAYTDKDLGLHMDLMYFENPPRYQLLHCLRNKVHGGQSYFVDGFYARKAMIRKSYLNFRALSRTRIPYMYRNDGHDLVAHRSVFERGPSSSELTTIAWSPPFQGSTGSMIEYHHRVGGQPMADEDDCFLAAIKEWERRINDPKHHFEFTMEEGDLVIFDNRRVLHARRGFRELTEEERAARGVEIAEGEPSRWLKGCYMDGDAVWDKLAVLRSELSKAGRPLPGKRILRPDRWDKVREGVGRT